MGAGKEDLPHIDAGCLVDGLFETGDQFLLHGQEIIADQHGACVAVFKIDAAGNQVIMYTGGRSQGIAG